jgi:hypothetical protein
MRKQQCWLAFRMHLCLCVLKLQFKLLNTASQQQLNSSYQITASADSQSLQARVLAAAATTSSK